jgi:M-phase inducer tyrosine phosphatase
MAHVLQGDYQMHYDELLVLDCRFSYEFSGGHIRGAHHIGKYEVLEELLFRPIITDRRVLVVLHCEFSEQRGPAMYFYFHYYCILLAGRDCCAARTADKS